MSIDRAVLFLPDAWCCSRSPWLPRLALVSVAHGLRRPEHDPVGFHGLLPRRIVFKGLGCRAGEAFR